MDNYFAVVLPIVIRIIFESNPIVQLPSEVWDPLDVLQLNPIVNRPGDIERCGT